MQPEIELFVLWKNGSTSIDIRNEPDDLAELLLAMDEEFEAVRTPVKRPPGDGQEEE